MIGEYDYDDLFYPDGDVITTDKPVTWILYLIFVIVMTITVMNMLIGLALDDIEKQRKKATE